MTPGYGGKNGWGEGIQRGKRERWRRKPKVWFGVNGRTVLCVRILLRERRSVLMRTAAEIGSGGGRNRNGDGEGKSPVGRNRCTGGKFGSRG